MTRHAGPSQMRVFLQVGGGALGVLVTQFMTYVLLQAAVFWSVYTPPYGGWMEPVLFGWLLGLPLLQLVYVVPMGIASSRVARPLTLGIALGAVGTFLMWGVGGGLHVLFVVLPSMRFPGVSH